MLMQGSFCAPVKYTLLFYVLNLKKKKKHILFFKKEGFGEDIYETDGVQYLQQGKEPLTEGALFIWLIVRKLIQKAQNRF